MRPGRRTNEDRTAYTDPKTVNGRFDDDHSAEDEFLKSLPDDPAKVRAKARAFFDATNKVGSGTQQEYRASTGPSWPSSAGCTRTIPPASPRSTAPSPRSQACG
ncbi:hypothetical protein SNL152K_7724 [Streptomyces sp. NL15-2K]|nr:hypothetical protein SNL152K_7724 [Streptomyces sp. NL15-2K]